MGRGEDEQEKPTIKNLAFRSEEKKEDPNLNGKGVITLNTCTCTCRIRNSQELTFRPLHVHHKAPRKRFGSETKWPELYAREAEYRTESPKLSYFRY
jgi:hypothetical protein